MVLRRAVGPFSLLALVACSASSSSVPATLPTDAGEAATGEVAASDAGPRDPDLGEGGQPIDAGLDGKCADTFGSALVEGFGRLDGVVYAVQKPSDTQCVMPNSDHLVLQVLMNGAVYRMVVNVKGSGPDPKISFAKVDHSLPAPAFAEGWHADAALDYVTTLGVHADPSWQVLDMEPIVAALSDELHVGDAVSVYATSGDGRPESAHLVHRNKANEDGAIVIGPTSATPKLLLFHFSNQTF